MEYQKATIKFFICGIHLKFKVYKNININYLDDIFPIVFSIEPGEWV